MSGADFRALCAELVKACKSQNSLIRQRRSADDWDDALGIAMYSSKLIDRALSALTTNPASAADKGGPSDEELMALAEVSMYLPYVIADDSVDVSGDSLVEFARAVLARHGTPASVPVAERLPGPGDCDDQGRCWWWAPKDPECPLTGHDSWGFYAGACIEDTHWLPHWALPLPEVQS